MDHFRSCRGSDSGYVTIHMDFMVPTNNKLLDLDAKRSGTIVTTVVKTQKLVRKWSRLHMARSMFRLAGAVINSRSSFSARFERSEQRRITDY